MAARFWVTGGTGNWNSTTNWSATTGGASGASVPGSADTATFDASSGSGTATLDISPTIQTLTCTGFTGTLAFGTNTISLNSTGTIFTGATTMAVTGTPLIICTSILSVSRSINPTAVTEANSISFRITDGAGTVFFGTGSVRDLDFTDGTTSVGFAGAIANNAITIYGNLKASIGMAKDPGTGTWTFAATSGTKTITTNNIWFDNPFTFNGVGGTWQLQDELVVGPIPAGLSPSIRTTTLAAGTLDLNGYTLSTGLFTCGGAAHTLAFGAGKIMLTGVGTVFTGSTTTTVSGTPLVTLTTPTPTTSARTINPTAVTEANSISFRITSGTGSVVFTTAQSVRDLDFTDGTNPTGFGGNVTNTAITIYGNFKASTSGMTRTAGTQAYTFAATSGTKTINTAGVTFDNPFTFNGVGGTFQLAAALTSGATRTCTLTNGTLDLASYTLTTGLFSSNNTNTRTIAFGTGNITVTSVSGTVFGGPTSTNTGLTITGTAQVNVTGNGVTTRTVNPGNSLATSAPISFTISAGSDTINSTTGMTFNNLTFTSGFTGTFGNVSRSIFGSLTLDASITSFSSGASTLTFTGTGSRTITTAGETIDCPITFNGTGGTFACQDALTLGSTRALTMTNGTLQLKSGTTNTVGSFATSGTTQKFLQATTNGSQATLSQASGTVNVNYLTIKDSAATGGAVFNAPILNLNADSGNNTGWNFIFLPNIVNEITMRFRSFTQPRRF